MRELKVPFGPLVTEAHPHLVPTGTATSSNNVQMEAGRLQKRYGFHWFTSNDPGTIVNMTIAPFSNGDIYLVVKSGTSLKYMKIYPSTTTWSTITDKWGGHHATDRGFFYMHADDLFYFDREGGTKWHPSRGTFKAGIGKPSVGITGAAASGGEMEGHYHVRWMARNSRTDEEGQVSATHTPAIETRLSESEGGIAISNWASIKADLADYDWDEAMFFCTTGDGEYITEGGVSAECFTFRGFDSATLAKTEVSHPGLNKADHVLRTKRMFTNAGGEPPGSRAGCFNGVRAVYADCYPGGTAESGTVYYSIPGHPTMVPQQRTYALGGDSTTFHPRPFDGKTTTGYAGRVTHVASIGGRFYLFTQTEMHQMIELDDRTMYPAPTNTLIGSPSEAGVTPGGMGLYGLSMDTMFRIGSGGGIERLSRYQFSDLITEIPAGYRDKTVVAYYPYRREVWVACASSGSTVADRILIYDEAVGGLVSVYTPANLGDAGIVAMCPLSLPNSEPKMLIGLSDGTVLEWPGDTLTDQDGADSYESYSASRVMWANQERMQYDHNLMWARLALASATTDSTLKITGMMSADDTLTPLSKTISSDKAGQVDCSGIEFDPHTDGNIYRIEITLSDGVVSGLTLGLERNQA